MSERIAVFGDKESVYGFAALGLDTYFFDPAQDNTAAFRKLCQSQSYSIIYITEAAASFLEKEIEKRAELLQFYFCKNENDKIIF